MADHQIKEILKKTDEAIMSAGEKVFKAENFGTVTSFRNDIAGIEGLSNIKNDEIIAFKNGAKAIAFNLEPDHVLAVMLDSASGIRTKMTAKGTGLKTQVPVGNELLGRVIDPLGNPLDNKGALNAIESSEIEGKAPPIFKRQPVRTPLATGILPIDALIPIGRGQRELIIGDRQTGKTAIAVDTIINQKDKNVICVYCSTGRQTTSTAKVIADLETHGAMKYSVVVNASGNDTPALNFIAPYSATAIAEWFMNKGRDVLVVYDDLTSHARSYRELSLLLRRPPAREAYPGDIFYIHSRLLERATHLKDEFGGGSITALPVVETEGQNIAAYIPTNLVSITDGQIYLSPKLFASGLMPAVDVGRSVSRVGGNAQVGAYRSVAGVLKLAYSQYEELESFSRFGTKLDEATKKTLMRGRLIKEILKQPQYSPLTTSQQICILTGLNEDMFDGLEISDFTDIKTELYDAFGNKIPAFITERINSGESLTDEMSAVIRYVITGIINSRKGK